MAYEVFGRNLHSKTAATGYFGKFVWCWIMENVLRFEKIHPDTHNKRFT